MKFRILVESRSWRDRNLKFGLNCDLEVDNLENNTPPGAKLGLCRSIIYSKLFKNLNFFQINLNFFLQINFSPPKMTMLSDSSTYRGIKRKVGAGGIGI